MQNGEADPSWKPEFQFLIGTIQTFCTQYLKVIPIAEVSIPHRYDPNQARAPICRALSVVSIPHRYDPNHHHPRYREPGEGWFQFLIGTIQTPEGLIGRDPLFVVSIPHRYDPNQMGRRNRGTAGIVSIPHRYDPNEIKQSIDDAKQAVSIPHRYDPNSHDFPGAPPFVDHLFQFLIGTIQTLCRKEAVLRFGDVSIPHRYDPNHRRSPPDRTDTSRVSIPHRYDPNRGRFAGANSRRRGFNSS